MCNVFKELSRVDSLYLSKTSYSAAFQEMVLRNYKMILNHCVHSILNEHTNVGLPENL